MCISLFAGLGSLLRRFDKFWWRGRSPAFLPRGERRDPTRAQYGSAGLKQCHRHTRLQGTSYFLVLLR